MSLLAELQFVVKIFILCYGSSDLQLAIALQQQEFEQQPQRQNLQQPSGVGGSSRLITGPQVEFLVSTKVVMTFMFFNRTVDDYNFLNLFNGTSYSSDSSYKCSG